VEDSCFAIRGVEALGLKQIGHAHVLHAVPKQPQPPIGLRSLRLLVFVRRTGN
jgi:hypothetical protein